MKIQECGYFLSTESKTKGSVAVQNPPKSFHRHAQNISSLTNDPRDNE